MMTQTTNPATLLDTVYTSKISFADGAEIVVEIVVYPNGHWDITKGEHEARERMGTEFTWWLRNFQREHWGW